MIQAIRKGVSGLGFVLVILGVACAGSPSIMIPTAMIAAGVTMMVAADWKEEEGNSDDW